MNVPSLPVSTKRIDPYLCVASQSTSLKHVTSTGWLVGPVPIASSSVLVEFKGTMAMIGPKVSNTGWELIKKKKKPEGLDQSVENCRQIKAKRQYTRGKKLKRRHIFGSFRHVLLHDAEL